MKIRCISIMGDMVGVVTVGNVYETIAGTDDGKYYKIINDEGHAWWVNKMAFVEEGELSGPIKVTW